MKCIVMGWSVWFLIPVRASDFSLFQNVQIGSGARPASHSMGENIPSQK
jgi:hypothetical protein